MKLTRKEYSVLYEIHSGRSDIERLSKVFSKEYAFKTVKKLEKLGLIKIVSWRDNPLYGLMLTEKGEKLLQSKKYMKWFIEEGD
ncbi:MAG: helix-turn-helix domain-containing protein [Candidatus Pacearchaeota archaeon]